MWEGKTARLVARTAYGAAFHIIAALIMGCKGPRGGPPHPWSDPSGGLPLPAGAPIPLPKGEEWELRQVLMDQPHVVGR